MSADNWAVCPRCLNGERKRVADLQEQVREGYGKLPLEEFDTLRREAEKGVDREKFRTFREDYEIYGAEDGGITVSYSGWCKTCELKLVFEDEHPIPDATHTVHGGTQ